MLDASQKLAVYVLGLGSNLGDRRAHLSAAVEQLKSFDLEILRESKVYQTAPLGPPQPDYFNAAIAVHTGIPPLDLLAITQAVERALGRRRPDPVRWGPRTMDIDMLWSDGGVISTPGLTVPHPGLAIRPFALVPLLDVAPAAVDPHTGERYDGNDVAQASLPVVAGRITDSES